jgi:hypothetical protein
MTDESKDYGQYPIMRIIEATPPEQRKAIEAELEHLAQLGRDLNPDDVVEGARWKCDDDNVYDLWPTDASYHPASAGSCFFVRTADGPWICDRDIPDEKMPQIEARLATLATGSQ